MRCWNRWKAKFAHLKFQFALKSQCLVVESSFTIFLLVESSEKWWGFHRFGWEKKRFWPQPTAPPRAPAAAVSLRRRPSRQPWRSALPQWGKMWGVARYACDSTCYIIYIERSHFLLLLDGCPAGPCRTEVQLWIHTYSDVRFGPFQVNLTRLGKDCAYTTSYNIYIMCISV